jgi:hypothetical protein
VKRALLAAAIVLIASVVGKTARQELPEGPGKDEVARLCAGCHDLTFTISTRETEADWTRIVNDMRSRGVDGTEEEFAKVIAYLSTHMSKAEPPAAYAKVELLANRTKVAPGERFALGLRLVAAAGWRLKGGVGSGGSQQVSWTTPQGVAIGDPARPVADEPARLAVFPAVVSTSVAPGSTLDLSARVAYEVCRETCLKETATASLTLPVGDGGAPSHEREFSAAK